MIATIFKETVHSPHEIKEKNGCFKIKIFRCSKNMVLPYTEILGKPKCETFVGTDI